MTPSDKAKALALKLNWAHGRKGYLAEQVDIIDQALREARAEGMEFAATFLRNVALIIQRDRTVEQLRTDMNAWADTLAKSSGEDSKA